MNTHDTDAPLWTASFVKICFVNLFVFVNFHALLPTFPFYVTSLGGNAVSIGVATALFSLSSILSRPFIGWLTDTKGRCTMLVGGLIGLALLPLGYAVSAGIVPAIALRTAHGMFHAAASNASTTWVTDLVPRRRMGEGLGMYGLSMAVSTAVAPALGLWVMNRYGFFSLFGVATAAALLALVLGLSISQRPYTLHKEPLRWRNLLEPMSVPASVTQFFFMMAFGTVEVYVAIYAAQQGLPSGGLYFIGVAVATVAARLLLGRTIDRVGEGPLVLIGNAALVAGMAMLVLLPNTLCYLISALLLGFSFGAVQPSLQTMAVHAVAPERRGAANSTFFISFDFGIALGGFLAGLLVQHWGYTVMFLALAFSGVASAGYYLIFGRHHASSFRYRAQSAAPSPAAAATSAMVITISRQYGSDGHRIGKQLAQELGWPLYDKELLPLLAEQLHIEPELIAQSDELENGPLPYDDPLQTAVFNAQTRLIRELAGQGPCVMVGRLANFILRGHQPCLSVFIYAPQDVRRARIIERDGVAPAEADAKLAAADRRRREYCLHYTGCDWGLPQHYDLMLDSSKVDAVELLKGAAAQKKPAGVR